MRAFLIGAAAAALFATCAFADDSVMASRFGNTTVTTDTNGVQTKVYYNADHSFTANLGGKSVGGTWAVDGGNLCLTFVGATNLPANFPNPTCLPVAAHVVGDSWTTGEGAMKRSVTLVSGIH